jgi:DNA-binding MarR family transcriptional regulator
MEPAASVGSLQSVLDGFVETVFRLMIDHHHRRVIEVDLTLLQAQALRVLHREPLSTTKLAAELRVSAPAATQLTDRLARKSLIERKSVDGDRRMVLLVLTARGRNLIDGFRQHRNEMFAEALGHLSYADQTEFVSALTTISAAIRENASQPELQTPAASDSWTPGRPVEASNVTTGAIPARAWKRIRMEWD